MLDRVLIFFVTLYARVIKILDVVGALDGKAFEFSNDARRELFLIGVYCGGGSVKSVEDCLLSLDGFSFFAVHPLQKTCVDLGVLWLLHQVFNKSVDLSQKHEFDKGTLRVDLFKMFGIAKFVLVRAASSRIGVKHLRFLEVHQHLLGGVEEDRGEHLHLVHNLDKIECVKVLVKLLLSLLKKVLLPVEALCLFAFEFSARCKRNPFYE